MEAIVLALAKKLNDERNETIDNFIYQQDYPGIAIYLLNNNLGEYRNKELIDRLIEIPNRSNGPPPVVQYFKTIIANSILNEIESIEFCKFFSDKFDLINHLIINNKFTFTEIFGDYFLPKDPMVAYTIYQKVNIPSKINVAYAINGMFDKLFDPNWMQIINDVASLYPQKINFIINYVIQYIFIQSMLLILLIKTIFLIIQFSLSLDI